MKLLHLLSALGLVCGALSQSSHDITESHLDALVDALRSDAVEREARGDEANEVTMRTIPKPLPPFLQSEAYNETLALKALNFAYLSYCSADCIDTASCPWSPPQNDDDIERTTVVDDAGTKTAALVGYEGDEDRIFVAFRGTHNLRNWLLDLNYDLCVPNFAREMIKARNPDADVDDESMPTVHCGFLAGYTLLRGGVLDAIQDLLTRHPSASLLVTGHSLGGAMANLAAIELSQLANPAVASLFQTSDEPVLAPSSTRLYSFGAPRTGDEQFAQFAHSHKGLAASYRIVNSKDPIPHLPFTSWTYHHIGAEVWYTDSVPAGIGPKELLSADEERISRAAALEKLMSEEQATSPPTDRHVSCNGSGEDPRCSSEVALWDAMLHAYDHLMYFGLREKCLL